MVVYFPTTDPENIHAALSRLSHLFTVSEWQKAAAFRRRMDQVNFLMGRLIVRTTLNATDPFAVEIKIDENGRPFVAGGNRSTYRHFNITHTDGLVAVIFSEAAPAGIDVEKTIPVEYADLLRMVGSPAEIDWFGRQADARKAFYTIWTLKEASLKQIGKGFLAEASDHCLFQCQGGDWKAGSLWMSEELLLSVALRDSGPAPVQLPLQPFQWEDRVVSPYLAAADSIRLSDVFIPAD